MKREITEIKKIFDAHMEKLEGLKDYCEKCLKTERWNGSVVLMIVDAAFTSVGLNYFTAVVPRLKAFERQYVTTNTIANLKDLAKADVEMFREIWKNKRSWDMAKEIASYLTKLNNNDREALRFWAKNSVLENYKKDPIGKIKGVGLVTFQYLRMMGGVDTVIPDRIVKKVINEIFIKTGLKVANEDMEFIRRVEEIAVLCGYKATEICWMTWLIYSEKRLSNFKNYFV